jgi:SPP1 family predicted phage head-tail adaptor
MTDYEVKLSDMQTRITFQQSSITMDAGGAQVPTWTNVTNTPVMWARWIFTHARGMEEIMSEAVETRQRATVTIRYRSDIKTTWRAIRDGEAWQILSIDHVRDQNRWTELIVERVKGTV